MEIQITRLTVSEPLEWDDDTLALTCTWAALQTFRPEYPFNTSTPLCLTAMRVKATHQMNGQVQTYNCMTRRVTDGFGHGWPTNVPRNPAISALYVLLGPGLYTAEAPSKIDWAKFAEWRDFCTLKGLKFDLVIGNRQSLGDTLKMIGAAGRARVYFDGSWWTAVIDKPRTVPIDVITPRNASNVKFEVAYAELPDALRIKFQDGTNNFQPAERIVRRPGLAGAIVTTEAMEMPGKTDPDEIYREAVRRFYELQFRNVAYSATQDGYARSATRGDLVLASKDILRRAMASARVKAVRGNLIEIDEAWQIKNGVTYAVGFRVLGDESSSLGQHVVRQIIALPGETRAIVLKGDGLLPDAGAIIMLGEYGSESIPLILAGIQRRDDGGSDLTLLPRRRRSTNSPMPPRSPHGKARSAISSINQASYPVRLRSSGLDTTPARQRRWCGWSLRRPMWWNCPATPFAIGRLVRPHGQRQHRQYLVPVSNWSGMSSVTRSSCRCRPHRHGEPPARGARSLRLLSPVHHCRRRCPLRAFRSSASLARQRSHLRPAQTRTRMRSASIVMVPRCQRLFRSPRMDRLAGSMEIRRAPRSPRTAALMLTRTGPRERAGRLPVAKRRRRREQLPI